FDTYFISDAEKIVSEKLISHFDLGLHKEIVTEEYLPAKDQIIIAVTSGASCPDSIVDDALNKLLAFYPNAKSIDSVMDSLSGV
ncbi:MAG: 4-hydroxy-3-methylbut-2-enyl diphosphate reductase, partial [Bacteroidetes bacterium]|nr:4-hydroxy-3-methylbut-2-enyl diphosphate reductase [Bacteroidota bacterium]